MKTLYHAIHMVLLKSAVTLWQLWPYVLCGVLVGEVLKLASWKRLFLAWIKRRTQHNRVLTIMCASVLGTVSPLCTYGTIPIVLQLFKLGVPLPLLIAFLSTSSLMNPQLFVMTWGGFGLEMAVVRAASVVLFGFFLGLITFYFKKESIVNTVLSGSGQSEEEGDSVRQECATGKFQSVTGWEMGQDCGRIEFSTAENGPVQVDPVNSVKSVNLDDKWIRVKELAWGALGSLEFVGFYFLLGTLLGSAVEVLLPGKWVTALFKPGKWISIIIAALLGVPLYACGGGTIPLVRSLMREGMSSGAALAFFLVGPGTRITPLISLATIIRPIYLGFYILFLLGYSVLLGFIYG